MEITFLYILVSIGGILFKINVFTSHNFAISNVIFVVLHQ